MRIVRASGGGANITRAEVGRELGNELFRASELWCSFCLFVGARKGGL